MLITHVNPEECDHRWTPAIYDPKYGDQPTGFETVDAWNTTVMRAKGQQKHEISRWRRVCLICGKIEESRDPF